MVKKSWRSFLRFDTIPECDGQTDGRTFLIWLPAVCMARYANALVTRKLCCRKDYRAMRPIYGCPEYSGLPDYAHGYYSQHSSWCFVPIDPMNIPTKFEVRTFTHSWDNSGYPKNLGSPWIRPRLLFCKIFNGLYSDWPCKCTRQICSP